MVLSDLLADLRGGVGGDEVDRDPADALLSERGGQRAQALLAAGNEHEPCIGLSREAARGRLADPARGAGDHRDERLAWGLWLAVHGIRELGCGWPLCAVAPARRGAD